MNYCRLEIVLSLHSAQRFDNGGAIFAAFAEDCRGGDEDVAAGGTDIACICWRDAAVHFQALCGFEAFFDDAGFVEH